MYDTHSGLLCSVWPKTHNISWDVFSPHHVVPSASPHHCSTSSDSEHSITCQTSMMSGYLLVSDFLLVSSQVSSYKSACQESLHNRPGWSSRESRHSSLHSSDSSKALDPVPSTRYLRSTATITINILITALLYSLNLGLAQCILALDPVAYICDWDLK